MADSLDLAAERRRRRALLAGAARLAAARIWRKLDRGALTQAWDSGLGRDLYLIVAAAQAQAAEGANAYTAAVLAAQGFESEPEGDVVATTLAGVASDGRPLSSLLYQPVIGTKQHIGEGVGTKPAMEAGLRQLELIVETQIIDAGRVADGISTVTNRRARGYVRVLTPPSCGRCAILAGRVYGSERPFQRHPRCLPAGAVVSGPAARATTRRWFEGEVVTIETAGGQQLTITGNHPVLTSQGWLPARLVRQGDDVVRSARTEATPLVVPREAQQPARVEDVWRAAAVLGAESVPASAEDFHGDGGQGQVDVVHIDRLLRDWMQTAHPEHLGKSSLGDGLVPPAGLLGGGAAQLAIARQGVATGGGVSRRSLSQPLDGVHLCGAHEASLRASTDVHALAFEPSPDRRSRHVIGARQAVLTGACGVGSSDVRLGQVEDSPRWDPPGAEFSVETAGAYASRGADLLHRLAGQVELDRVVDVRRVDFSGHVYNFSTGEGWYTANTIVVSNCDCQHLPVGDPRLGDAFATSAKGYFDSLSRAQQDRIFTKAGAEAIRDGADPAQVVNARRGMYSAGGVLMTREGITRRGVAGRALTASGAARGRRTVPVRLMPEAIYQLASDRAEILSLLRRYGYIT